MGSDPRHVSAAALIAPRPVPICDNCRRVVDRVHRIALMEDGAIAQERDLCTACRCQLRDVFSAPAPWLDTAIRR